MNAKLIHTLTVSACVAIGALAASLWHVNTDLHQELVADDAAQISTAGGDEGRRIVGATATVRELQSGLKYNARIDTGAHRTSLHVAEWTIADPSPAMDENIGKAIRFRIENRQGESRWLERKIVEVALIRTSEQEEYRYLVPLKFLLNGVEREVLVSLNDRSQMSYALLVGRNFLAGEFVVDVTGADSARQVVATGS